MPESVAYPCGDLDDFGAVGHGVDELEAALVQLQRDVLLPRVARVDAQDDTLKKQKIRNGELKLASSDEASVGAHI